MQFPCGSAAGSMQPMAPSPSCCDAVASGWPLSVQAKAKRAGEAGSRRGKTQSRQPGRLQAGRADGHRRAGGAAGRPPASTSRNRDGAAGHLKAGGMASNKGCRRGQRTPLSMRTPLCAPRRLLFAPQCRAHPPLSCLDLLSAGIRHLGHASILILHLPQFPVQTCHGPERRGRSHTQTFPSAPLPARSLGSAHPWTASGVVLIPPK
jgi:hypothetical protein